MKRWAVFLVGVISASNVFAQQFGGTPTAVKWKQINTDTVRIIYSAGADSTAQRVATLIHQVALQNPASLGDKMRKINIVLQNQTTIANGYVGLGPFRSEFYLTPDPNSFDQGSMLWADQLALHEYRHVMQYNNFRNGLSKAMYYLFGEEGLLLANDAAVPDWFFEGDAVNQETILSSQGRGRLPFFLNTYSSLWMKEKKYSFMKLRNNSFKDYIPSHYNLGYLLVNYGREKYGDDFWKKVTQDASSFKGLFYPWQKAIKKYSGENYQSFYKNAFEYYKKQWNVEVEAENYVSKVTTSYVTNYLLPYQVSSDSLLYLKSSYRQIPTFYIKDKNGEHRLRVKNISGETHYSYRSGKIVYASYERDPRWLWRDYTVLTTLDIRTGEEKTITHKTKYFTPDISNDGTRIVAVQNNSDGKSELHIVDAADGKILKEIKSAEVKVFTDPKFIDDNYVVAGTRLINGTMALSLIDLNTGSVERLTPPSFSVVGYPCEKDGIIYFTASYSGNDDVYAIRLKDRKFFQLTADKLGNYYINVLNGKAIASHFTADGYQLKEIDISNLAFKEINAMAIQEMAGKFSLVSNDITVNTAQRNFETEKYNKATRLFNFHSWRPYYEDPDFTFTLYGQNILNNFQTEVFYHYNQNEKTNGAGVNAVYGGLFPYLNIGTEYTFNRTDTLNSRTKEWDQLDTRIGLSVPLNFTKGKTLKALNIGTNYVLRNEFIKGVSKLNFDNVSFSYLHHFLIWQQTIQSARQHIYPRLGYTFSLNHRYAISYYNGYQFSGKASLYLPGFYSTHNLVISGDFQQRDTSNILFSNLLAGSRGYLDYYLSRMWKLSANYHFPIVYPDWGFGNILYFQRIRGNAFYDYSRMYSNDKALSRDLRSVGGEIYFDTKWWNQYPLTFGFRVSHLLDRELIGPTQANVFEFILPVSIIPR